MRLEKKISIVTGSGSGIGKSIALKFGEDGAIVIVLDNNEAAGKNTTKEILSKGGKAEFIKCDISSESEVLSAFGHIDQKYARVDVLVNNAGTNFVKPFIETEVTEWDSVLNIDLRGTFICMLYAAKIMVKRGGGAIVNIASVHTQACLPGAAPYDAAKWGMVGLTKAVAVELASKNVRVNALSPGLINTQIWSDILDAAPDSEECTKFWNANIPMQRVGEPEEVASLAAFLASDEAAYITGSNMIVDGGMSSQLISQPS